jgi:hypothetical protein
MFSLPKEYPGLAGCQLQTFWPQLLLRQPYLDSLNRCFSGREANKRTERYSHGKPTNKSHATSAYDMVPVSCRESLCVPRLSEDGSELKGAARTPPTCSFSSQNDSYCLWR